MRSPRLQDQLVDQPENEVKSVGQPQITELEPQTSVERNEPPIPAWKRLISGPLPTDERISLITAIFSDSNEADVVNLDGDDTQTFIDVIDEVLSHSFTLEPVTQSLILHSAKQSLDMLPPGFQKICLGTLCKICGRLGLLPRSVRIQVPYDRSNDPLYTGGYADVWKGQYQDSHVAVKVLRVCANNNFEKITRVGTRSLSETICSLSLQRFCREAVAWKSLRHPNVLPLLGVMMRERCFVMVSEWMDSGNMNEYIWANRNVNRFELVSCPCCWLRLVPTTIFIARRRC